MFDQFDNSLNQKTPVGNSVPVLPQKPIEDIFADTDMKEKPPIFQPKNPANIIGLNNELDETEKLAGIDKKYFMLGLIVLILAAVLGGGLWGFSKYGSVVFKKGGSATKATDITAEKTVENNTQTIVTPNVAGNQINNINNTEVASSTLSATTTAVLSETAQLKDSDQDGLTDEEEKALGIDLNNSDTDGDGLFDREEVKVYHTDPLNPDTDGDGYKDGDEVKNGFNPKGPGKLFQINK